MKNGKKEVNEPGCPGPDSRAKMSFHCQIYAFTRFGGKYHFNNRNDSHKSMIIAHCLGSSFDSRGALKLWEAGEDRSCRWDTFTALLPVWQR